MVLSPRCTTHRLPASCVVCLDSKIERDRRMLRHLYQVIARELCSVEQD